MDKVNISCEVSCETAERDEIYYKIKFEIPKNLEI